MKTLAIDIETYSEVDLLETGVYPYAEHESFEIMLFAYSIDGQPVQIVDLASGELLPFEVDEALTDPEVVKTAFNANFERTCLASWLNVPMPPEQWQDTMILASELGLPRSLDAVGKALGLKEDKQKMKEGKDLIRYFAKPCKPTKSNGMRTRNLPEDAPEKWEIYKQYNIRDVEAEQEIRRIVLKFGTNPDEQRLWEIDQKINDAGVGLDVELALQASLMDQKIKDELKVRAKEVSGLENPNSVAQIKKWIFDETGIQVASLEKKVMNSVREQMKNADRVNEFLDIRKALGKTSTAKYSAMLRCHGEDNRIRGLTQFYGASRTGRWAGRLVQMQNLPQNKMPDDELDLARSLVKAGDLEALEMLFDPADALSQLIRTSFIPKPGHKFVVSDFSAIEARVLAWLAGESWRMDVFNTHGKIYEASAEQMFHLPPGSVKKGDPMRTKGKIAELALGYGGSVGALRSMGALEMGLEEKELKPLVDSWRAANSQITSLWWNVDAAVKRVIQTGAIQKLREGITIRKQGPLLRIKLPSGREISYVKPAYDPTADDITYDGQIQSGGWGRIESYGPKFVENIVQATARDCLAVSMNRLDALGIQVVFHVHDEVICEVPEDKYSADDIAEIMGEPIEWAEGLPLKADAYECHYYRKD